MNILKTHPAAKRETHKNGKFVCRIDALDIERGIGLGKTTVLGFLQSL